MPNPDDPFGDDEDHEKLAALAKSFEEKYVSKLFKTITNGQINIYIYKVTGNSLNFLKINLLNYIIYFKRVTCKESC